MSRLSCPARDFDVEIVVDEGEALRAKARRISWLTAAAEILLSFRKTPRRNPDRSMSAEDGVAVKEEVRINLAGESVHPGAGELLWLAVHLMRGCSIFRGEATTFSWR